MSLYIGNLSPRVCQEELERVFGRFGNCTIKLKDGYGFAVYGIRAQADVALRALRGRNICGLPISLSWSNKQPNKPQAFNRGPRSYEIQHGRGFERRDDHMNDPLRFDDHQQHYKFRYPDSDARRLESNHLHVEKGNVGPVYEEQEHSSQKQDGQDASDNTDHNLLESGRWGEQIGRLSNDTRIDDEITFDRYEPARDYERPNLEGSRSSPTLHDRPPNSPGEKNSCFKCGNVGHKSSDCPLQGAYHRKKLCRSNDRRGSVVNRRHGVGIDSEEAEPSSRRRLSSTSTKERVRERKDYGSGRHRRLKRRKSSPVSTDHNDHGKVHGRRKQSEDDNETFKDRRRQRTRRSLSRSMSQSSSAYSSRSGSTSRSSVLYSSSSLMSDSKSNQQKSGSAKSRSIPHKLLSLSPPNKTEVKLDGSLDISSSMQTKPVVTHERQRLEVLAEDSIGCGNTGVDVHSNLVIMQVSQQLEVVSKEENVASESTLMVVQDENMIVCVDGQDDFKIDNPQTNDDQSRGSLDNKNGLVRNPSRDLRDESELQTLGGELHVPNKSGSKITSSTRASYTSISLGELDIVMKHYNLKDTGENGGQLSLEEYFSCARMWPWEIIYYRKLKKGPISTENYARRLAQNEEFGITDKYVRSSSGWGEPTE